MAHFAQIDENNIVTQVLVVPDAQEHRGQDYLANDLKLGGTWIQTSYNARIRKNYAGIGFSYDSDRDAFIPPKPFESWVLNEDTCTWDAPVARPEDGKLYNWDEETTSWVVVEESPES
jgi:hypothetical protein